MWTKGKHVMSRKRRIRTSEVMQARAQELRKRMTTEEKVLWERLRDRKLGGYKFRRQHPIGPFIADFYCAQARLVVEIDGSVHAEQRERDRARDDLLESWGYHVIRFWNSDVVERLAEVLDEILSVCRQFDRKEGHAS